jgi:hypothetical protein
MVFLAGGWGRDDRLLSWAALRSPKGWREQQISPLRGFAASIEMARFLLGGAMLGASFTALGIW